MTSLSEQIETLGISARTAARTLAITPAAVKDAALRAAAAAIRTAAADILAANALDMASATELSPAMKDRLMLDAKRIEVMAAGIAQVAALPDPVGRVLQAWDVAGNGLHFERVSVPLGVIGIIYESRPNVTADAAALAIKAGNAVILRGGAESFHSSRAILAAMHAGFNSAGLPENAAQMVPTTDREAVAMLLTMHDHIDVIIPRGGRGLTTRIREEARVPTLLHLDGNCHLYVAPDADIAIATRIVTNAKLRRTGVCGSLETLLIDTALLGTAAPILTALLDAGCELRGDAAVRALDARILPANNADWETEYLAPILAVRAVDGVDAAIAHINRHGSHHTDGIISTDAARIEQFMAQVDSAIVLANASTQFADGGEFGFGGEIGIATGRLHARGPVGAAELTTYKTRVTTRNPDGAIRAG